MKSKIALAYCTFPGKDAAENICRALVAEGVIACANVFQPHASIYRWNNQIQTEQEVAVLMKLNARKRATLKTKIRAAHPYAVPALVIWPIEDGLPEFIQWVYGQSL